MPQFFGIYLGASWAVIQFVDWMAGRYLLSPHITDLALITLVSLTPAVLLLAFYHGAPGHQPLSRAGKIGVPLNIAVTVALLGMFLQGRDLSAAAKNVTVTDEDGQQVTHLIANESARRKAGMFYWANDSGDPELEWMRYALPMVLHRDLSQNPFVDGWSPTRSGGIFARLVRAGFEDGLGAPIGLQRKIAEEWHLDFFVDGRFDRRADRLVGRVTVYQTESGQPVAEHEVEAADAFALVDSLTPFLLEVFDVPRGLDRIARDLPAAELLTADMKALHAYTDAFSARLMGNDLPAAIDHFRQAVEIDPTFAMAQFLLGDSLFQTGQSAQASKAMDLALRHDYKLLENDRFQVKGYRYLLDDQIEKRDALFEMWVELHPTDVTALASLASVYEWSGNRIAEARRTYQRIYDLHPVEAWALRKIAQLALLQDDKPGALAALERYAAYDPESHEVWIEVGVLRRGEGDLDAAREAFEKASLMSSGFVNPSIQLANLATRVGDFEEAESYLDNADGVAADAQQRAIVLRARLDYDQLRGRLEAAFARLELISELEGQYRSPIDVIIAVHLNHVQLYEGTGRGDQLEHIIDAAIEQFGPPFDRFLGMGYMLLAIEREDPDTSEHHRVVLEKNLAALNRGDLAFLTEISRAHELRLRGQHDDAIAAFESALEQFAGSSQSSGEDSLRVELQRQLAITHRQAGHLDAAEHALREALPLMPANPRLLLELAQIQASKGEESQARENLDRALAIWADADSGFEPLAEAQALATSL